MSIDYIRKTYSMAVKIGMQAKIKHGAGPLAAGRVGKVTRADGAYLVVKGDGWKGKFHPDDVEPLPIPTLTPTSPIPARRTS